MSKRLLSKLTQQNQLRLLITGGNGHIAGKLFRYFGDTYPISLIDSSSKPNKLINNHMSNSNLKDNHKFVTTNLLEPSNILSNEIDNSDTIIHLAAENPFPNANWMESQNCIDINNTVFMSCVDSIQRNPNKKLRIIFASSNHIMGGYLFEKKPSKITINTNVNPGTKFKLSNGYQSDSTMYAIHKFQAERILYTISNKWYNNIEVIILRIGWIQPGINLPNTLHPSGDHNNHNYGKEINKSQNDLYIENWFKTMWLSNIDLRLLFNCAINFKMNNKKYYICNGVSNNTNTRWCLKNEIGYKPSMNVNDFDEITAKEFEKEFNLE